MVSDERGQALSFEGIAAAIILLAAVGFALQVTAVTPLSPSTSSQHVENQIQSSGEGVLDSAYESGALQEAVLYWDPVNGTFHGASGDAPHYQGSPPGELVLSETLNRTFGDRSIAYNVFIHYHEPDGGMATQSLIEQGRPSDHAVSASRTLVLFEGDRLVEADGSDGNTLGGPTAEAEAGFYAPDINELDGDNNVYNVVHVEVVAWRI